jgi:ferric-dicitrate binding protein FerR (iron transport regulator)
MDRLKERYRVARLIAGELAGTLDEAGARQLEAWKNVAGGNARLYERVKQGMARELVVPGSLDACREWQVFERAIVARSRRRWAFRSIAATVAIIVATVGYLYFPFGGGEPGSDIVKRHAAMLVLDDGERVMISESTRGVLFASGGARVIVQDHRLQYEGDEFPPGRHALIVPRGGEYEIELPDGTRAWLNSGSRLTFPGCFDGATREVEMEGEVCFDVVPGARPFIVRTGEVTLRVVGTLFNVEAYPGEAVVATLVNGSLRFLAGDRDVLLCPGQRASVMDGDVVVEETRAGEATGWTRGFFTLTEASLETIMKRLSRWYDMEVEYRDPGVHAARFTVEIKRYDNIADVLSKIEMTGRVRFSIDGKKVVVEE